jgi:hypothetical protein
MYQLCLDRLGNTSTQFIRRLPEKDMIPVDPKNSDYQEYLQWLNDGGLPLPHNHQSTDNS